MGGATHHRATALVDPEALVLMSLVLAPGEPHLGDRLGDWIVRNSDLLSVQRIGNLVTRYPPKVRARLAAVARSAIDEGKDHRWMSLAQSSASTLERRQPQSRSADARLLVVRPALVLRLRLAFGVGIKADILSFLLGADPPQLFTSIAAVAMATGYTVPAVRKAAKDLVDARFIEQRVDTRVEIRALQTGWEGILGAPAFAAWRGWNERFVCVAAFLERADAARAHPLTPHVLATRGMAFLQSHAGAFRWLGAWKFPREGDSSIGDPVAFADAVTTLAEWMLREA